MRNFEQLELEIVWGDSQPIPTGKELVEYVEGALDELGPVFLAAIACPACAVSVHGECYHPVDDEAGNSFCCCQGNNSSEESGRGSLAEELASALDDGVDRGTTVDRIKAASEITDVTSTGRKRAKLAYPITEGMICEWAKLKTAGGGVKPIVGCAGNLATDRHHGPDKNTLNNTEGNVHRICADCHNRWHAANDAYYGQRPSGTEPFIPLDGHSWSGHDAVTTASDEEILANEIYWRTKKKEKKA